MTYFREELNACDGLGKQGEMLFRYADEYKSRCLKRLYQCTAWIYTDNENNIIWLKSYNTMVSAYDIENGILHHFGRYSMTTYQHFSRLRRYIREHGLVKNSVLREVNHNFENWF